ncbi:hypothetical protein CDZ96_22090 [Mameliella alba]|nr:hypothetical protein CDZ96_22090 [Mameliella alba]
MVPEGYIFSCRARALPRPRLLRQAGDGTTGQAGPQPLEEQRLGHVLAIYQGTLSGRAIPFDCDLQVAAPAQEV